MSFVLPKLTLPIRWAQHGTHASKQKDPRVYFLQRLALLEKGEQDDYRAALALEQGKPLPPQTKAQVEMSKACFSELLEKFLVADIVAERPRVETGASRSGTLKKRASLSVECVVCRDTFESIACLNGPCGHFICYQCVIAMAEVANKNEDMFPLQCCQQPLPTDALLSFLPTPLRTVFSSKCAEAATPANLRIYCPDKTCSHFIGRRFASTACVMSCPACGINVCLRCKTQAHPGESCDDNEGREIRALAEEKGWKTCPGCKMIVERSFGCSHMVCRCRKHFCYNCGAKWARCACLTTTN